MSRLSLGAFVSLLVAFAGAVTPLQVCVAAGERGCVGLVGTHALHEHEHGHDCRHAHDEGCPEESDQGHDEGSCCADEVFARCGPGGSVAVAVPACEGFSLPAPVVGSDVVTAERPLLAPGVLERESVVLIR